MLRKILLVQFRPDPAIRQHELDCFIEKSNLPASVFYTKDLTDGPISDDDWIDADAVILGGSGDYLVSQGDAPHVLARATELLHALRAARIPTLGVCYGSQLITHAFAGRVALDASRQETGAFEIRCHDTSRHCPIFHALPDRFHAALGHKDHLEGMPLDAIVLASSERSPVQAFTFRDAPMYGFLFHPELDLDSVIHRMTTYSENYAVTPEALDVVRKQFEHDISFGAAALRRFIDVIVLQGARYGDLFHETAA